MERQCSPSLVNNPNMTVLEKRARRYTLLIHMGHLHTTTTRQLQLLPPLAAE